MGGAFDNRRWKHTKLSQSNIRNVDNIAALADWRLGEWTVRDVGAQGQDEATEALV